MIRFRNICLLAILFISVECVAQKGYLLSKSYSMKIAGTSSLHNWDETVGSVAGYLILNWNSDGTFNLDATQITIDVNSIKGESSVMNNKTLKALKADSNKQITLTLDTPVKSVSASSQGTPVSAKCKLTIAGVTKIITLQVKISSPENGKLEVDGSQVISMPDYNITPPTAFFGTLKTGSDVTINFSTTFVLSNQ